MIIKIIILVSYWLFFINCNSRKMNNPHTVFEKKDIKGKLIEKYSNYYDSDRNTNFKFFYFYNEKNQLVREKRYFLDDDNKECNIIDSLDYADIIYQYDDSENLQIEKIYQPKYNDVGKVISHYLSYQKNYKTGSEKSFTEPD